MTASRCTQRGAVSLFLSPRTPMRTYVITTGAIFGLLVVAHIWRMFVEGHLARQPEYLVITLVAAALSIWAARLAWSSRSAS